MYISINKNRVVKVNPLNQGNKWKGEKKVKEQQQQQQKTTKIKNLIS